MIDKVGFELLKRMLGPGADAFGENFGIMIKGLTIGMAFWGEGRVAIYEEKMKEFLEQTKVKKSKINKKTDPDINIAGPVFDASFYYFDKKYYRELFSNLLANASNEEKQNIIHPSFVDIIKQLSPLESKILNTFSKSFMSCYPLAIFKGFDSKGRVTPYYTYFIDFLEENSKFGINDTERYQISIENLVRLGLLQKRSDIIQANYDYNKFKNNLRYKVIEVENPNEILKLERYRIELTLLGRDFVECCCK
ncbi:hypothetical protein HMPREF0202_01715 [Cetobacterium somerae ATCC BAA-474]|uniref:DUF4393 domain-containing protein n=1 Tax=Cetobacterium somerae ATCC BAA-474 TaxID=1319815 RepID=U7VA06_9FUSO|nr:DUF4393 domain-containing protein [Cetobacterium somerae]ERT68326.1 hypothetical protein HMPREF0202_01715 [Cetobacterium somerae ATCC BAA-474]